MDSCPSQTEHTVDLSEGFSEAFPARLYRPHPDSAVGLKPAQPPGMGYHPKSGRLGSHRVETAILSLSLTFSDATLQYSQFEVL